MANYTGAASGGLSGAATGFQVGGPWGAAVGGALGAAGGLFGGRKKKKRVSSLDKRQQQLNKQQYSALRGEGPLADIYNYNPEKANDVFDKTIADPAYRNFREKLAPNVTGQFRSQGLMQSSYAGDALSRLARDVQENLNAERSKYLYGQENAARSAKQGAVENLQNRQTFGYDTSAPSGRGFDVDSILKSITPQMTDQLAGIFNSKPKVPNASSTDSQSYAGQTGAYRGGRFLL